MFQFDEYTTAAVFPRLTDIAVTVESTTTAHVPLGIRVWAFLYTTKAKSRRQW